MPTTTNYGWTTPADTDLVKDGAAAIRSLGTAIDTTTYNNAQAAIAKTIVDAKGDLIVATAADTVSRLAVGANGTTLVADSAEATGLKWAVASGGGKVLQVVEGTTTTQTTSTSSTFIDTNLTASITPTAATSKILVIANQAGCMKLGGDADNNIQLKLYRGATEIGAHYVIGYTASNSTNSVGSASIIKLDSPATTSAITYKTQFRNEINTSSVSVQRNSSMSTIILMEIGV